MLATRLIRDDDSCRADLLAATNSLWYASPGIIGVRFRFQVYAVRQQRQWSISAR